MYTKLSRRLCQAFVSASYSHRNRPIFRQFLEINRPSAGNRAYLLFLWLRDWRFREIAVLYKILEFIYLFIYFHAVMAEVNEIERYC